MKLTVPPVARFFPNSLRLCFVGGRPRDSGDRDLVLGAKGYSLHEFTMDEICHGPRITWRAGREPLARA